MPQIHYIDPDGARHSIDVKSGHTVMEGARDAGVPGIVAECGGACACSTCHIYVDPDWISAVPEMEDMEEDMLDFAPEVDAALSRLSCQLKVTAAMDGLVVRIPAEQA
ncbi:2Fe-2S iron-sulfur cluster-binding protein [Antarctobacter sp.]|uniref:2Fe-2S iron-sulfur cluster-binding protein n=1 Tax=Antarctobacter sp. TaxID=1872577 RepID=UPI003A937AE8